MSSPVNPIVSGLLHGYSLAHAMTQQRLQQEALAREVRRDEEDRQIRDISMQEKLSNAGRPVDEAGLVGDTQTLPGMKGPGMTGPGETFQVQRKADKARTVTYKTASGRSISSELYTPEEQGKKALAAHIASTQAAADVQTQAQAQRNQQKMDTFSLPISDEAAASHGLAPGARIMQGPGFAGGLNAIKPPAPPKVTPPKIGERVNKKTGDVTPTVTTLDAEGNPVIKAGKAAPGIAAEADKRAPGQISDYQKIQIDRQRVADERRARLDAAKEQNDAQKQVDALNRQEQLLHQENREIGARLIAGSKGSATDKKGKSVKVTPEDAAALKAKLADNQAKVKALQDRQHGIIMKFAGGGANPQDPAGILGAQ